MPINFFISRKTKDNIKLKNFNLLNLISKENNNKKNEQIKRIINNNIWNSLARLIKFIFKLINISNKKFPNNGSVYFIRLNPSDKNIVVKIIDTNFKKNNLVEMPNIDLAL